MSKGPSWDDLQVFRAVLDGGSLSAAARRLNLAQPTVRNRIDALERTLGVVLFTRSAAGLVPTESAQAIGVHVLTMALASDAVVRSTSGALGEVAGTVRLSVSELVAAVVLPPMIVRLRRLHPALAVEIVPSNETSDLIAQEADIALRMYPPRQESLVARKVGAVRLGFFAHRDYVARRGMPQSTDELIAHDIIGPDQARYDLELAQSVNPTLGRAHFSIRTDSHVVQLAVVRAGAGIGVLQLPVGQADPNLVAVLPHISVGELKIWLVMHKDLRRLPKIRTTFDHLVGEFEDYSRATA